MFSTKFRTTTISLAVVAMSAMSATGAAAATRGFSASDGNMSHKAHNAICQTYAAAANTYEIAATLPGADFNGLVDKGGAVMEQAENEGCAFLPA
jgi:hypothetical protein